MINLLEPIPEAPDPVLARMKELGLPLTLDTYLQLAYPEGAPNPMPGELLAAIPAELRDA